MTIFFNEICQKHVLYSQERNAYSRIKLFESTSPSEFFGGIHMLRFVVYLSSILPHNSDHVDVTPPPSTSEITTSPAIPIARPRRATSSDSTGLTNSISGDRNAAILYLLDSEITTAFKEIITELDTYYPLASPSN